MEMVTDLFGSYHDNCDDETLNLWLDNEDELNKERLRVMDYRHEYISRTCFRIVVACALATRKGMINPF